jgi:hypothetical protein
MGPYKKEKPQMKRTPLYLTAPTLVGERLGQPIQGVLPPTLLHLFHRSIWRQRHSPDLIRAWISSVMTFRRLNRTRSLAEGLQDGPYDRSRGGPGQRPAPLGWTGSAGGGPGGRRPGQQLGRQRPFGRRLGRRASRGSSGVWSGPSRVGSRWPGVWPGSLGPAN